MSCWIWLGVFSSHIISTLFFTFASPAKIIQDLPELQVFVETTHNTELFFFFFFIMPGHYLVYLPPKADDSWNISAKVGPLQIKDKNIAFISLNAQNSIGVQLGWYPVTVKL